MKERLSLCMVVRDEEQDLPRCLESVRGVVDEIIVVDTGSKDETMAVARRHDAVVRQIPWQNDFAAARNASLELASGDWVLVLDADEALLPEGRHALPQLLADPLTEGYFLTVQNLMGSGGEAQYQCDQVFRLFRNRPLYRFVGAVHEQILPVIQLVGAGASVHTSPLRIIHYGYLDEYVAAKGKRQRNLRLLQASLAARPGDPFLLYNLGIEHARAGSDRQALKAFGAALAKAPLAAPWRPGLVKWYANVLHRQQRWPAALDLLRQGTTQYPDYTDLHYVKGLVHGALAQWDEAVHHFQTCLRLGPAPCPPYSSTEPELGASKALYSLGRALQGAGRYGEAQAAYLRAAAARPGWMAPWQLLVRMLAAQGDDGELDGVLEEHFPGDAEKDRVMAAMLLGHAGRYERALKRLQPLVATGELSRSAGYVYALTLAKLGRCEEALAICGQGGWEGSAFVPKIRALTLYCRLRMGDPSAVRQLTAGREGLPALYTDLAGLVWDEPEEQLSRFCRELPQGSLLAQLATKERVAGW